MRKYAISIDKVLFHIFPCNERVDQLSDILAEISRGSYAIMLFPSPFADFAIECYSADGKRVEE